MVCYNVVTVVALQQLLEFKVLKISPNRVRSQTAGFAECCNGHAWLGLYEVEELRLACCQLHAESMPKFVVQVSKGTPVEGQREVVGVAVGHDGWRLAVRAAPRVM